MRLIRMRFAAVIIGEVFVARGEDWIKVSPISAQLPNGDCSPFTLDDLVHLREGAV